MPRAVPRFFYAFWFGDRAFYPRPIYLSLQKHVLKMLRVRQFHGPCLHINLEPSASQRFSALPPASAAVAPALTISFPACSSGVTLTFALEPLPVVSAERGCVPITLMPVHHWGPGAPTRRGRLSRGWIGRGGQVLVVDSSICAIILIESAGSSSIVSSISTCSCHRRNRHRNRLACSLDRFTMWQLREPTLADCHSLSRTYG